MKVCPACAARFSGGGWTCPECGKTPRSQDGVVLLAPELAAGDGSDADYELPELRAAEGFHFWFRARRELVLWAMRRYFAGAESFFEIGCGTGYVLAGIRDALPGLRLAASDLLLESLSRARERLPGVPLLQMDVRRATFEEEFDLLGAFDVIEHVDEDRVVLRQMANALRPGGGLLLTVPQHAWLWNPFDEFSCHRRRYARADLVAKLRDAGFEVLRATSFFAWALPLLLIRARFPRSPYDPAAELRIGRLANAACDAAARLERRLIRWGISFPLGGSLLLVARKAAPVAP